jgi:serine/threonine protein kinase
VDVEGSNPFYELLCGRLPFDGDTPLEMFAAVMTHDPVPLRERFEGSLPAAAEAIVGKCLQRDRVDRYPSMAVLARDLRAIALSA